MEETLNQLTIELQVGSFNKLHIVKDKFLLYCDEHLFNSFSDYDSNIIVHIVMSSLLLCLSMLMSLWCICSHLNVYAESFAPMIITVMA